jgi:hypothetical protein
MSSNDRPPFPHFKSPSDVLSAWMSAIQGQREIWSTVWSDALASNYGPDHLLRDLARAHRLHVDTARVVLGYSTPSGIGDDAAACVNIQIHALRFKRSELRRKTKTARFDVSSDLRTTELAPVVGSGRLRFRMEATAVSAEHVLIEIIDAVNFTPKGSARTVSLQDALKNPSATGNYLGMVSTKSHSGPPLVLVNLSVRGDLGMSRA